MTTNPTYHSVDNNDYSPVYYSLVTYNKLTSLGKNYVYSKGFEANEIVEGLYLGSIDSAFDFEEMKKRQITHVISAIAGFIPGNTDDFKFLVVDALDSENTKIAGCFEKTNEFIDEALSTGGKVLIHCMAGRSRSASILAAYLICCKGMSSTESVDLIRSVRPIIQPNPSFSEQLSEYEKMCTEV